MAVAGADPTALHRRPSLPELQQLLENARAAAADFQQQHPAVSNTSVLLKRIERDIKFLEAQSQRGCTSGEVADARLQGIVNNLRGFHGEVCALHEARQVEGVCMKFRSSGSPPEALQVEVDLVADGGLTWVEVKNQESFSVESMHFTGASHFKGLRQQVVDLLAVAASPRNWRRWRPPQVVIFFPSGVMPDVAAALQELGATVANGRGSLAALAPPESPPALAANLDVTTLCALCSEVTANPHHPSLQQWAARTVHWQECLNTQLAAPLLAELQPVLDSSPQLVASCAAVKQMQQLMSMFGGRQEQQRWQELLAGRLQVHHCAEGWQEQQPLAQAACPDCGASLNGSSSSNTYRFTSRVQQLGVSQQQKEVFALGDAMQAVTLTANANAVRAALSAGVHLEAVVHRPVWLTGV